jgi:hypothetical protein
MIHVEIFTVNHVIRGELETFGERLTDILNNRTKSSLMLKKAEIIRLLRIGQEAALKLDSVCVTKTEILLAKPVEHDRTEKSIFRKATRQLFTISLVIQNFELMGQIHMTERTPTNRLLIVRTEDFIPLTNAQATYVPTPKISFSSELIIFNKAEVCLVGESFSALPTAIK